MGVDDRETSLLYEQQQKSNDNKIVFNILPRETR